MSDQNQKIFKKVGSEALKKVNGILLSLKANAYAYIYKKFNVDEPVTICISFYEEVNQRKFKEAAEDEGFTNISFTNNGSAAKLSYPFDYEKVRKTEIVNVVEQKIIDAVNEGLKGRGEIEKVKETGYDTWYITFVKIKKEIDKKSVFSDVFNSIAPLIIVDSCGEYGNNGFWFLGNLRHMY